jgi:polyhydroxybutyrate depolymerase
MGVKHPTQLFLCSAYECMAHAGLKQMTYFRLGFIVLLAILASCRSKTSNTPSVLESPSSLPSPPALILGDAMGSVSVKNHRRTYLLFTPKSYRPGKPAPLVLAFHGYGSQGKDLERATGFSKVAHQEGFLIVYPDGLDRQWQTGRGFFDRDRDDSAFVLTLIRQIAQVCLIFKTSAPSDTNFGTP